MPRSLSSSVLLREYDHGQPKATVESCSWSDSSPSSPVSLTGDKDQHLYLFPGQSQYLVCDVTQKAPVTAKQEPSECWFNWSAWSVVDPLVLLVIGWLVWSVAGKSEKFPIH